MDKWLARKEYGHLEYNVMACTNTVRSEVFFWSALPFVCLILDHLLCPDCAMVVVENARRHLGHIAAGRASWVTWGSSLKVCSRRAIGNDGHGYYVLRIICTWLQSNLYAPERFW